MVKCSRGVRKLGIILSRVCLRCNKYAWLPSLFPLQNVGLYVLTGHLSLGDRDDIFVTHVIIMINRKY